MNRFKKLEQICDSHEITLLDNCALNEQPKRRNYLTTSDKIKDRVYRRQLIRMTRDEPSFRVTNGVRFELTNTLERVHPRSRHRILVEELALALDQENRVISTCSRYTNYEKESCSKGYFGISDIDSGQINLARRLSKKGPIAFLTDDKGIIYSHAMWFEDHRNLQMYTRLLNNGQIWEPISEGQLYVFRYMAFKTIFAINAKREKRAQRRAEILRFDHLRY
jgi:hypothetical protein